MAINRNGESIERVPVRCQRFYKLHNFWYFETREGASVGPYDSQEQAKSAVKDYVEFIQKADDSARDMLSRQLQFAH